MLPLCRTEMDVLSASSTSSLLLPTTEPFRGELLVSALQHPEGILPLRSGNKLQASRAGTDSSRLLSNLWPGNSMILPPRSAGCGEQ